MHIFKFDIVINKPFKVHLHTKINEETMKPKLQEVFTWVKNVRDKIMYSCCPNLTSRLHGQERTYDKKTIAQHDRLGPMVLKEMK